MSSFGELYSRYYDLMYQDKDYKKETDYVLELISKDTSSLTLLDIGCGTGKHAEFFSQMGLSVHGVDYSDDMLDIANERARNGAGKLSFSKGNAQSFRLEKQFDIVVSLFHVMSYQTDNHSLINTIETVRKHIKPGGIFIFDFWYGPGVLSDKPAVRVKRLQGDDIKVTRIAEPTLYVDKNTVDVNYEVDITDTNTGENVKKYETHKMRYFFDPELEMVLQQFGFSIENKFEWMSREKPSLESWNAVWVVKG